MPDGVVKWTETHERLAAQAAHGYYWLGATHDDVLQEARLGVLSAIRSWDPARGGTFEGFAFFCARRAVITALRLSQAGKHTPINEALHLDRPVRADDDTTLAEILGGGIDPARAVIARDELLRIFGMVERLSDLEREVFERIILHGEEYAAIGDDYKRVDNAVQRVRRKLADDRPAKARLLKVYVDRSVYATERAAVAQAMQIHRGEVVSIAKRKLIDGHERAPQGRARTDGRRGQPVWRVDIREAA